MLIPSKTQWRKWTLPSKYTAVGTLVGLPIAIVSLVIGLRSCGGDSHADMKSFSTVLRDCPVDPNTGRTDLYARTKARIDERADYLIREKIHSWLFMTPGSEVVVTLHNGRAFTYSDFEFEGTPRDVFWKNLIDPFLEEASQQVLDEVGKECRGNGVASRAALKEAGRSWLLESMVRRVYREMVDVDQGLRGKGYPESVPKRDVEWEVNRMIEKVRQHVDAATALYSGASI